MLRAAWGLLRETGRVLLEAAPEGYAPGDIVTAITGEPSVASVHDVHAPADDERLPGPVRARTGPPARRLPPGPPRPRKAPSLLGSGLDHTTLQRDHVPDELLTIQPDPH